MAKLQSESDFLFSGNKKGTKIITKFLQNLKRFITICIQIYMLKYSQIAQIWKQMLNSTLGPSKEKQSSKKEDTVLF